MVTPNKNQQNKAAELKVSLTVHKIHAQSERNQSIKIWSESRPKLTELSKHRCYPYWQVRAHLTLLLSVCIADF